jgi:hypothetical protein
MGPSIYLLCKNLETQGNKDFFYSGLVRPEAKSPTSCMSAWVACWSIGGGVVTSRGTLAGVLIAVAKLSVVEEERHESPPS